MNSIARLGYEAIHRYGPLADIAYRSWRTIYNFKERFQPRSRLQTPSNGVYPIISLNISTTAVCNAACRFCPNRLLESREVMPMDRFQRILDEWKRFGGDPGKAISLTPGTPPGEAMTDPTFTLKLRAVHDSGFKTFLVTNAILLDKFARTVVGKGGVSVMGVSIGSLDRQTYKNLYGVDRCDRVIRNLIDFLILNKEAGEPVDVTICFRNEELPSKIMENPVYYRLTDFFSPKVRVMFTTWWDDWGGAVPREEMEGGEILVRKPLNTLKRVCMGALSFSMRPDDDLIRLCGCRYIPGQDDLVVGHLDKGFADAQRNAFEIQDGFKRGIRPPTCQNCGAYKQA